jgi:hypothetical protein
MISFSEFLRFDLLLSSPDPSVEVAFLLADTDRSGTVSAQELAEAWRRSTGKPPPRGALAGLGLGAGESDREIGLEEFKALWVAGGLPSQLRQQSERLVAHWETAVLADTPVSHSVNGDDPMRADDDTSAAVHVAAQCVARAVSCTVRRPARPATTCKPRRRPRRRPRFKSRGWQLVAPLDRVKIMCQALGKQAWHDDGWGGYRGLWTMLRQEGLRGAFRGNLPQVRRPAPLRPRGGALTGRAGRAAGAPRGAGRCRPVRRVLAAPGSGPPRGG